MTESNDLLNQMQVLENNNEDKSEDDSVIDYNNGPQLEFQEAMQMFSSGFGECAREAIRYLILQFWGMGKFNQL